jgi:DNA primase
MALPDSFLDELRARTPLGALVGRRVRLTRAGRELKGLCPFHNEKTPSFHVVEDKGFFHCFGCGAHGDAITFVMRCENLGFMEAVERLASEAGMTVPRASPEAAAAAERIASLSGIAEAAAAAFARRLHLPEGRPALDYLRRRGLADETIRLFGLGWSGEGRGAIAADLRGQGVTVEQLVAIGLMKQDDPDRPAVDLFFNRVMFPIRDRRGRVIGFGGRTLGDGQPKYLNGPETGLFSKRRTLYGLDLARANARAGAELVVVEGYMDVIALHQAGFGGAVAPLGTALTAEHLAELWRISPAPVLCFDGDAAGARAALRTAEIALPLLAPGRTLALAALPPGEDPDTLVLRKGADGFRQVLAARKGLADALFDAIAGPAAGPEERAAQRRRLDELAGRIQDRDLGDEYRRHFRDRWFRQRQGARSGAAGPATRPRARLASRPTLALDRVQALRERNLLALLLTHPGLLPRFEEALAAERFTSPPCEQVRTALIGLDPKGLVDQLRSLGLAEALEAVLGRGLSDIPPTTLPEATPAEAGAAIERAFAGLHPERLEREVAEARAALAADFCEANLRRLQALDRMRAELRAELAEDPAE